MICTLFLPAQLYAAAEQSALAAFPRECCGLIEGVLDRQIARATALHPVRNLAAQADRFELDPAMHIRHLRAARERRHALIGCYHSHPNGRAEPSAADAVGAGEEGFLWLIAAVAKDKVALRAFVYAKGAFAPVALEASPAATL